MTVTTQATGRRSQLAAFLRSRRARLTPEDVGLPPGLRRRTPGLRREELAQLAGVGVTWYTWLEQGRPINASVQVLDAIARTLRLDQAEREHLYRLADVALDPPSGPPLLTTVALPANIQQVLDAITELPAVVYSSRYDVLAWNAGYGALFPGVVLCDRPSERNVLWHLLAGRPFGAGAAVGDHLGCCGGFVNRDAELPTMVATLRSAFARHVGEPEWEGFVRQLSAASPEFTTLWAAHDVAVPGPRTKILRHWSVGQLNVVTASFALIGTPEARMVMYTPSDPDSAARIARLLHDHEAGTRCPRHHT